MRSEAVRCYAYAVAFAVAALVLTRLLLAPLAGAHFIFSMAAVCLAALTGGTGPGLLALVICAAGYPVITAEAMPSLRPAYATRFLLFLLFLVVGAIQAAAAGAVHSAYVRARTARLRCEHRSERHRRVRARSAEQLQVLRSITSNLAEGLYALDAAGRLVFMNAAASRMLGWREEELVGQPFHEIVHPRRADGSPLPSSECPFQSVLRTGNVVHGQDQVFVRKDGAEFPVSYSASPIVRGGKIVGGAMAFQDFSERLRLAETERFVARATQELTESIDWEATLSRVAALAVPFLGDWCLLAVQEHGRPRGIAFAGADPARAQEFRDVLEQYPIDPDAQHGVARVMRTGEPEILSDMTPETFVPESGEQARARLAVLRRLGLRSYIGVPLVARGRIIGAMAFGAGEGGRRYCDQDLALARELAARCALAIDNARLYREAQEATQAREEVLAVVSHDLRAPLAAVQLSAQLVARHVAKHADPALRRAVDTLRRATARGVRLGDDLVDFARLERGKLALSIEPQDPSALAREAILVAEPLAADRKVTLAMEGAPELGAASCDGHRILQVLANLVGNAIKVSPAGGTVRVAVRRDDRAVRFTVADSGPGIAAADLARVFERYWRAKDAAYEGSGLGLAIAKAVVEAHGGRLWVESAPGGGAAFHFTIPLDDDPG